MLLFSEISTFYLCLLWSFTKVKSTQNHHKYFAEDTKDKWDVSLNSESTVNIQTIDILSLTIFINLLRRNSKKITKKNSKIQMKTMPDTTFSL